MGAFRWKSFLKDEDRPGKPRLYGITEIRGPGYNLLGGDALEDTLVCMGQFVDGLKFSGGSQGLMLSSSIKKVIDLAHAHNVYVSTGDWADHLVHSPSHAFRNYVSNCKSLGFDAIDLSVGSLDIPEEKLLRFIRTVCSVGLKARPQLSLSFRESDIPPRHDRAFGSYVTHVPRSSEFVEDMDLLIRRAERCLEAGADMIVIDPEGICMYDEPFRSDVVAKLIGRLGVERTMFETFHPKTCEWFIRQYGPRVNLFVDHRQLVEIECLRNCGSGADHARHLHSSRSSAF